MAATHHKPEHLLLFPVSCDSRVVNLRDLGAALANLDGFLFARAPPALYDLYDT
jgi:hypothetical protein